MTREFEVQKIALHLVDRQDVGPRLSKKEAELDSFGNVEDKAALETFFEGHLKKVWEAQEGRRTIAASFLDDSPLPTYIQELEADPSKFFTNSCKLAQRLYDSSKGRSASSGLLMVLSFRRTGDSRRFLGLFKMDPGPSHKIIVRGADTDEALLELAVRHVEQALPDPKDQLLKWAVLPHPTRPVFAVKAQDKEGSLDPAQYFIDFLGCQREPNELEQFKGVLQALREYGEEHHADEDWEPRIQDLKLWLERENEITYSNLVAHIVQNGVFRGFDETRFQGKLAKYHAASLHITDSTLPKIKFEYSLPGGIIIRGPWVAMENQVQVEQTGEGVKFTILATSFEGDYV